MNIFILVLAFLFMAGYYFMDSPSQTVASHDTSTAIRRADLRSVADCAASAHTAAVREVEFLHPCVQLYEIESQVVCMTDKMAAMKCEIVGKRKPDYSFIVTKSNLEFKDGGTEMLDVLEQYYPDSGLFGIFNSDAILTGGGMRRNVSDALAKAAELKDSQIVYITQYEIPDLPADISVVTAIDIECPSGMAKTFRFGKWQCIAQNVKGSCAGDKIWNFELGECVDDTSRKPLCSARQTAVMINDAWECVDPFADAECPTGQTARMNYDTLVWECIPNVELSGSASKCEHPGVTAVSGGIGRTLTVVSSASCTDCEMRVTDPDTCATKCVPDTTKLNNPRCYPSAGDCSGSNKAFYFGFPNAGYAAQVSEIADMNVPFGVMYSQNRKFNCMNCGDDQIDSNKSKPPYIAVCE